MSGTVLFEECDLVFADVCAVLDRVNAAFECNGYAERTFNVRRNLETEFVRLVAARFYDFGGHTQHAGFAFFFGVQNAARDHKFDKVGFGFCNFANIASSVFRVFRFVCQNPCHMPVFDGYRHVRGNHSRRFQLALFAVVANFGVDVVKAADRADRRYARHKFDLGIVCAQTVHDLLCDRVIHQKAHRLFVLLFGVLWHARSGKMHVKIDKAGEDVLAVKIDNFEPVCRAFVVGYACDFAVLNDNVFAILHAVAQFAGYDICICNCVFFHIVAPHIHIVLDLLIIYMI